MIPLSVLFSFCLASFLLCLAPGPDNIFVLTQSAMRGRNAGLFVTLGLCTGLCGHTLAVALGLAVILQTSALAFSLLKLIGAIYLLYLAWQAFRAGAESNEGSLQAVSARSISSWKLYQRGIIMNSTNPKVSLFFLAFLPQFTSVSYAMPIFAQIVTLGAIFILMTILVFGSIALFGAALGQWFTTSPKSQIILNRIAGTIFLGLALKLAMARQ